jgi:enolase
MRLGHITVREIFDSRGSSTIEALGKDRRFWAQVPSGKSRGSREAKVANFTHAVRSVKTIVKRIGKRNFDSVRSLDKALLELDGTKNKSKLGGNVTLAVSVAFARALAAECQQEVWQTLRSEFFPKSASGKSPLIFSNLINGGAHADNNLNIQEYMVVVKPGASIATSVKTLVRFYDELAEFLKRKNKIRNIALGDEGGYALDFKNNFEPIIILEKLIRQHRLGNQFLIALDSAATGFYKEGEYRFGSRRLTSRELASEYARYFKNSKLLFSIEDPFAENDMDGFALLREKLPHAWIVGDDLTVTNPSLIERAAREGTTNAVIIKPNQIGTVSEACEAMLIAKKHNMKTIVSHRSGETADNFIIHLAKAGNADGVKIGAPIRERNEKFNELIRIF